MSADATSEMPAEAPDLAEVIWEQMHDISYCESAVENFDYGAAEYILNLPEMQVIRTALRSKYVVFRSGWVFDSARAAEDLPPPVVAWLES